MRGHSVQLLREVVLSHAAIVITIVASLFALGGIAGSVVEAYASHRWGTMFAQSSFLAIVGFLIYGGLVYQLARLGYLRRLMRHRAAADVKLRWFFHTAQAPSVTVLVPSYREDPQVVRRTLLSAALQDYPKRRVVLLIDDPSNPSRPQDIELPAAAQSRLSKRLARGPLDATGEILALAQLHREAASWFEEQAIGYPVIDHADELFVELTFRRPAP